MAWYAIHVRSRHEKLASTILTQKGCEVFLPSFESRRRWSDRFVTVTMPLFPGYFFCKLDPAVRMPVTTTPGVVGIVGDRTGPCPVDPAELDAVRLLVESGLAAEPLPFLVAGQRVLVERGPLTGLEGVIMTVKNQCRLVVSVTLLNRSVATEIDRDWVRHSPRTSQTSNPPRSITSVRNSKLMSRKVV